MHDNHALVLYGKIEEAQSCSLLGAGSDRGLSSLQKAPMVIS